MTHIPVSFTYTLFFVTISLSHLSSGPFLAGPTLGSTKLGFYAYFSALVKVGRSWSVMEC